MNYCKYIYLLILFRQFFFILLFLLFLFFICFIHFFRLKMCNKKMHNTHCALWLNYLLGISVGWMFAYLVLVVLYFRFLQDRETIGSPIYQHLNCELNIFICSLKRIGNIYTIYHLGNARTPSSSSSWLACLLFNIMRNILVCRRWFIEFVFGYCTAPAMLSVLGLCNAEIAGVWCGLMQGF